MLKKPCYMKLSKLLPSNRQTDRQTEVQSVNYCREEVRHKNASSPKILKQ